MEQKATLSAEYMERRVAELINLPTLPGILKKVSLLTEDEHSSASDIASVVSADQVLSAKILRLVNSPVYGFPGRISSVQHAIVLLGFNVVKGLVLGTAVFDAVGPYGRGLWSHSLGCAVISRHMAMVLDLSEPDEVMVAGLLHDLGKLVLAVENTNRFTLAVKQAKERGCHIALVERELFSVDHSRVAGWIARDWHFPQRLADPLAYHHRPNLAKNSPDVTALVHVADILARGMGYGFPGDETLPPFNEKAYHRLNLTPDKLDRALAGADQDYALGAGMFVE
jgi:HD-like signal output (HDOD) protein